MTVPDAPGSVTGERPDEPTDAADPLPLLVDPAALVFDLDGTLVDTVETRIEAWMRTFAEVGIPADRRHVAGLIGADGRRLAREVAAVADRRLSDDRAEAIDRRAGELHGALNTDPRPTPGATDLLTALAGSRLAWAIATSSRPEQVTASVAALALPEPPPIVDGSHVAHAKPAPDLLLLAAERLDAPAHRTWYVGDATWDMMAAKAAAMPGIGIITGVATAHGLLSAGARVALPTLVELHAELARRGTVPAGPPAA